MPRTASVGPLGPFDLWLVLAIAIPVLVVVVMGWRWRWTHDDGFINLRVVDQVFAGNGPVYNAGVRVEAYTSPLHIGLLVLLRGAFSWIVDPAWIGCVLTLVAMAAGLVGAAMGSVRLARAGGARTAAFVPFGLLVPVALPPTWEYATSGLETGIAIGWLGLTFWLLARVLTTAPAAEGERGPRLGWVAVVAGLGPLVRPECTVFSLAFLAVLAASAHVPARWWPRARVVLAGLALPFAYEIFRMGYFAALVPNTALAKAAGGSRWDQGWYYFVNLAGPYGLAVPALAFVAWFSFGRKRSLAKVFGGADGRNLVLAMVGSALLYGLYVVRVGGDYMHGRMLLIPLFALCCPLAMVAVPPPGERTDAIRRVVLASSAVLVVWAGVVATSRRPPEPEGFFGGHSISEQRPFWVEFSGNPHPVPLSAWSGSFSYRVGDDARTRRAEGEDVLITQVGYGGVDLPRETPLAPRSGTKLFLDGIGVAGAQAGTDVPVIDLHGLADPIAARMPPVQPRGLPGHEKVLPQAWALAEAGLTEGSPAVVDAAAALRCGQIRQLQEAIAAPMTVGRFVSNLGRSFSLTTLEIPRAPSDAAVGCARVS